MYAKLPHCTRTQYFGWCYVHSYLRQYTNKQKCPSSRVPCLHLYVISPRHRAVDPCWLSMCIDPGSHLYTKHFYLDALHRLHKYWPMRLNALTVNVIMIRCLHHPSGNHRQNTPSPLDRPRWLPDTSWSWVLYLCPDYSCLPFHEKNMTMLRFHEHGRLIAELC
jgi:hypothetical protein